MSQSKADGRAPGSAAQDGDVLLAHEFNELVRRDVSDALHADEVTGKTFQNQRKVTDEEVPADVFRRPDENRPGIEVALEHSKTFLDAPKPAQVREDLLRGGILVGGGMT